MNSSDLAAIDASVKGRIHACSVPVDPFNCQSHEFTYIKGFASATGPEMATSTARLLRWCNDPSVAAHPKKYQVHLTHLKNQPGVCEPQRNVSELWNKLLCTAARSNVKCLYSQRALE